MGLGMEACDNLRYTDEARSATRNQPGKNVLDSLALRWQRTMAMNRLVKVADEVGVAGRGRVNGRAVNGLDNVEL